MQRDGFPRKDRIVNGGPAPRGRFKRAAGTWIAADSSVQRPSACKHESESNDPSMLRSLFCKTISRMTRSSVPRITGIHVLHCWYISGTGKTLLITGCCRAILIGQSQSLNPGYALPHWTPWSYMPCFRYDLWGRCFRPCLFPSMKACL